jgi:succinyl-CoA synthetase beta subunit
MDIHEYQAKEILKKFGVAVPDGALAYSPEQAAYRARELGGNKWIVKAQVHAGGRGKAGGVKLCDSEHEIQDVTTDMFGRKLVTHQTGPEGKGIYRVYVEAAVAFEREIYLGFVLDRTSQRVMIVASSEGGMEIEEISENRPESIVRSTVEPAVGLQEFQAREIAFALGIPPTLTQQMARTLQGCYRAFRELDATMVEINPLVITADQRILALDAKMTFDTNALFRHPQIAELRDKNQEDPHKNQTTNRNPTHTNLSKNARKTRAKAGRRIVALPISACRGISAASSMAQALRWRRWTRSSLQAVNLRTFWTSAAVQHPNAWPKPSR